MTRYGEACKLDKALLSAIAVYMDDEIRERVHYELAPCEPEEFLARYCELDMDFSDLLEAEFGIEMQPGQAVSE